MAPVPAALKHLFKRQRSCCEFFYVCIERLDGYLSGMVLKYAGDAVIHQYRAERVPVSNIQHEHWLIRIFCGACRPEYCRRSGIHHNHIVANMRQRPRDCRHACEIWGDRFRGVYERSQTAPAVYHVP